MDELTIAILKAARHLNNALSASILSEDAEAYKQLGKIYDLLDDIVGAGARDKCESAESSDGS